MKFGIRTMKVSKKQSTWISAIKLHSAGVLISTQENMFAIRHLRTRKPAESLSHEAEKVCYFLQKKTCTRKPAESLSHEYRKRRNRLLERAHNECLKKSLLAESSRVPSINSIVEDDVFSASDDVVGLLSDNDSSQHPNVYPST
ncbi:hypothetical protein TSAR_009000 [Trichomalopsis sarcophagae]|uniref:Uncharacterized protein n=1 Tax=Trichomalopsis sarcophagae TaxID=543379 RepID=A0A232EFD1_9HYME|nr:hypothetical protein TSAR_009000 [Trichomalopsis sarcophagae]